MITQTTFRRNLLNLKRRGGLAQLNDGDIIFRHSSIEPGSQVKARLMHSRDGVAFIEAQYKDNENWQAKPAHWLTATGYKGSLEGLAGQDIFDKYNISQGTTVQNKKFNIAPGTYLNNVVVSSAPVNSLSGSTSNTTSLPAGGQTAAKPALTSQVSAFWTAHKTKLAIGLLVAIVLGAGAWYYFKKRR